LAERISAWQARVADAERQLAEHQREIDDIAFRLYGIAEEDRRAIEQSLSGTLSATSAVSPVDSGEEAEDNDV
jgi:hypothetical protein